MSSSLVTHLGSSLRVSALLGGLPQRTWMWSCSRESCSEPRGLKSQTVVRPSLQVSSMVCGPCRPQMGLGTIQDHHIGWWGLQCESPTSLFVKATFLRLAPCDAPALKTQDGGNHARSPLPLGQTVLEQMSFYFHRREITVSCSFVLCNLCIPAFVF